MTAIQKIYEEVAPELLELMNKKKIMVDNLSDLENQLVQAEEDLNPDEMINLEAKISATRKICLKLNDSIKEQKNQLNGKSSQRQQRLLSRLNAAVLAESELATKEFEVIETYKRILEIERAARSEKMDLLEQMNNKFNERRSEIDDQLDQFKAFMSTNDDRYKLDDLSGKFGMVPSIELSNIRDQLKL